MGEPKECADEVQALHAEIQRLNKVVKVLMDRAERSTSAQGSDFSLFQATILLENQVRERTAELEASLRENERITRALRDNEEKLRTLIEAIPDVILVKDGTGRWQQSNAAARQTFGLPRGSCYGKTDPELAAIAPDCYREALLYCVQSDETAWQAGELTRVQEVVPQPDGSSMVFDVVKKPLFAADGARRVLIVVGRDMTEQKQAEEKLRITASVFENAHEAVIISDAKNHIIDVNPAFTRITGYSRAEVIGKSPKLLSSGLQGKDFYAALWQSLVQNGTWSGEIWNRRKSGEIYAELLSIASICDDEGKLLRYVGMFSDISYLKKHEAELSRIANYDTLTGVPNRRLLSDRLRQAMAHVQRNKTMLAVCYLDLDGFKQVNDRYGHEAGDMLLVEVTRRLQDALRADDTLARLGGDEFVILFNDIRQEQECLQAIERILKAVTLPISIGDNEASVSASIGVTFYPADDEDGDTLLRHADQAMYVAKQAGKNRHHVYEALNG